MNPYKVSDPFVQQRIDLMLRHIEVYDRLKDKPYCKHTAEALMQIISKLDQEIKELLVR